MSKHSFNSKIGVVLAAAGSAVGLGNIWKFPYMVGENGGSAFLLIYLVCCVLIGLPIMISEFSIGKRAGTGIAGAFQKLSGNRHWQWLSIMGFIVSLMLLSFYSVVTGWCIRYLVHGPDTAIMRLISSAFALLVTTSISWFGVQKGIERMSKLLMPILIFILFLLIGRALMMPNSHLGMQFLFRPDFSKINGGTILNAMGQAFFSLSVGMGVLLTYGSYMPKHQNIVATSVQVVTLDTLVAILSGLAIFPAVFSMGFNPAEGPQLVFDILPRVFDGMTLGGLCAVLFFLLLTLAAITSLISMMEVSVSYVSDRTKLSRHKSLVAILAVLLITMTLCCIYPVVFDSFDNLVSLYLMPLGGLAMTIFVGWFQSKNDTEKEIHINKLSNHRWIYDIFFFLIRYVIPIIIMIIFLHGLGLF